MSGLGSLTWLLLVVCCYVLCSSKSTGAGSGYQAIKTANLPNRISPTARTPTQQQQQQQQAQQQQQQAVATTMSNAAAATAARQKRSQHLIASSGDETDEYFRNMSPYVYNLALLNIMRSLQKQLTNIESPRMRPRLGRSAAAFQLLNDVLNGVDVGVGSNSNGNGNGNSNNFDSADVLASLSDASSSSASDSSRSDGSGIGHGASAGFAGNNDLVGVDIEDIGGAVGGSGIGVGVGTAGSGVVVPWQFRRRVSKKSSALYKPRLGKRTQTCN